MVQTSSLTAILLTGQMSLLHQHHNLWIHFASFTIQSTFKCIPAASENPSCPFLLLYRHSLALAEISITSLLQQATCIWQRHQHSSSHLNTNYWISFDVFLPFHLSLPCIIWGQVNFPFLVCLELLDTFWVQLELLNLYYEHFLNCCLMSYNSDLIKINITALCKFHKCLIIGLYTWKNKIK